MSLIYFSYLQLGATRKDIQQAEQKRQSQRQTTDDDHYQERAKAARQLMAEIFAETLVLPAEPKPNLKSTKPRASKLGQTVTKPPTSTSETRNQSDGSKMVTKSGQAQQRNVPKGTYLFIDSDAYPPRRTAVDSRTQRFDSRQDDNRQYRQEDSIIRGRRKPGDSLDRHVPPIQLDYSSDEDYYDRLKAISEATTENKENEPERDYTGSKPPKSYKDIVRMRRPEVTRKKRLSPRKQKTYGEMLKELKQEANRPGSSSTSVRDRQRLHGELAYWGYVILMGGGLDFQSDAKTERKKWMVKYKLA